MIGVACECQDMLKPPSECSSRLLPSYAIRVDKRVLLSRRAETKWKSVKKFAVEIWAKSGFEGSETRMQHHSLALPAEARRAPT